MATILVVDDDDKIRKLLKRALEKAGHRVLEASNGKMALSIHIKDNPELVITDIVMPEKEGLETIAELKERDPVVKIIAMSGGGRGKSGGYLQMAEMFGADGTLEKPFLTGELVTKVADILSAS